MGKKKNKSNSHGAGGEEVETKNYEGDDNNKSNKKESKNVTVVLKADLHCEGCASKVIKSVRSVHGVETAVIEADTGKITVVGEVDPGKLRDKVEHKTRKKVELISPKPSKKDNDDANSNNKENNKKKGNDNEKQEDQGKKNKDKNKNKNEQHSNSDKNNKSKKDDDKKADDKKKSKDKEPPVTTAVLKVHLHCEGCIQKIYKTVTKTKGYQEMKFDPQKDLVTVTGSMDMKALAEVLQKQLKKEVVIVPPKKDAEKKEKGGGDKESGGGENVEINKGQSQAGLHYPFVYGPGVEQFSYNYNPYAAGPYHAPQIFSDENPNACSVM